LVVAIENFVEGQIIIAIPIENAAINNVNIESVIDEVAIIVVAINDVIFVAINDVIVVAINDIIVVAINDVIVVAINDVIVVNINVEAAIDFGIIANREVIVVVID